MRKFDVFQLLLIRDLNITFLVEHTVFKHLLSTRRQSNLCSLFNCAYTGRTSTTYPEPILFALFHLYCNAIKITVLS